MCVQSLHMPAAACFAVANAGSRRKTRFYGTRMLDGAQAIASGQGSEISGDLEPRRSDQETVRRLLDGDESVFNELVDRFHGQMVRVARHYVSTDASAEEVVQDTWVAVLKGLSRFEGRSSLKTWMFRILTNRAKTKGVREGRQVPFSSVGGEREDDEHADADRFSKHGYWSNPIPSWTAQAADDVVGDREMMVYLEEALGDLPENQRLVATLRDVQGFSSDEVCDMLDISEGNQRVLLHRARAKLRKTLEQHLGNEN